jgi:hypothetical protein
MYRQLSLRGHVKDIHQVLKEKEEELARITQEVEALRLVMRLLTGDGSDKNRPTLSPALSQPVAPRGIKDFP